MLISKIKGESHLGEFNQNEQNQQNQFNQTYGQGQQPYQNFMPVDNSPLSMGQYLVMMLLMFIPLVNIILLFVWGFGDYNVNKKNFARAQLIIMAISIVLGILFMIFIFSLSASILSDPSYY